LSQWIGSAHDYIRIKAGGAADVEGEIAERDSSGADRLNHNGLGHGQGHDVIQVEVGVL